MCSLDFRAIGGIIIAIIWSIFTLSSMQAQPDAAKVREENISLDVKNTAFSEIIEGIRAQTQADIVFDSAIEQVLVEIRLTNKPWKVVLKTIAEKYKCSYEETEHQVIKISKPPEVSMELEEADIRDVVSYIAEVANENIVLSEQVKGKISLRLKDVPWLDALETVVKNRGYVLVREKGNILRVVQPEEIQAQLETEVFPLRYIRPKSSYIAKMSTGTSHFSGGEQATTSLQQQISTSTAGVQVAQFSLLTALNTVLTKDKGRITYDETTNTLIITDVKPKIEKMKAIIRELDREPKQVFIDLKFVRTTNSDIFDFGVDVGDRGVRVSQTLGSLSTRFPFTLGRGGFEDAIAAAPESVTQSPGTGIPNVFPDNPVSFGVLDFSQTSFTLRLLKRDVRSKIIQAPKIITLDHHEATIFVGRSISFARSEIQQNDNGSSSVEIREAENSPAQEGFQMLVVPHTLQDTNKIQLTIIISNDTLTGQTSTTVRGFNRFEVAGVAVDLPESTRQIVVTHMILETGQTAVLGGLLAINQSETINKVPFLGDIPFIGYFFKNKTISKSKEDLFIFLTPRIVQSAEVTRDKQEAHLQEIKDKQFAEYQTIWQEKKEMPASSLDSSKMQSVPPKTGTESVPPKTDTENH